MKPSEQLETKGWKKVSQTAYGKYKNIFYWHHPNHQHQSRGFFTTTQALTHQERFEKLGRCRCIPKEFVLHEETSKL